MSSKLLSKTWPFKSDCCGQSHPSFRKQPVFQPARVAPWGGAGEPGRVLVPQPGHERGCSFCRGLTESASSKSKLPASLLPCPLEGGSVLSQGEAVGHGDFMGTHQPGRLGQQRLLAPGYRSGSRMQLAELPGWNSCELAHPQYDYRECSVFKKVYNFHSHVHLCCSVSQSLSGRLRRAQHLFLSFFTACGCEDKNNVAPLLALPPRQRLQAGMCRRNSKRSFSFNSPQELIPLI